MKPPLQSVLPRLLDDWTVRPVGGGRRRQADVLVVAATNLDLSQSIASGGFHADLFYRLNTVEIELQWLRNRTDFAAIARHSGASLRRTGGSMMARSRRCDGCPGAATSVGSARRSRA